MLHEGSFKKEDFERYLSYVVPSLPKGSTLVMDNAAIHKKLSINHLLEKHDCRILYLPPYSPECNPIEKLWGSLKSMLRRILQKSTEDFLNTLWDAIEHFCGNRS